MILLGCRYAAIAATLYKSTEISFFSYKFLGTSGNSGNSGRHCGNHHQRRSPVTISIAHTLDVVSDAYYVAHMIKSFANTATRQFAETGKSKFSGLDIDKASQRLSELNAATALSDISPLKSVGLHALSGNRAGQWAMTINGGWRLVFRFSDGNAHDVEIVDYHE